MARNRQRAKGRRESGPFVPLPCHGLNHPNFWRLTGKAQRCLLALLAQLRFKVGGPVNNGDLCATWSVMQKYNFRSKQTLEEAVKELLHYGFIQLTRQGGRHQASLYAVAWWAINECGGKLDCPETRVPSREWATDKPEWQPRRKRKAKALPRISNRSAPATGAPKPTLKVIRP